MSTIGWSEFLSYTLVIFGIVLVAIALSVALARWWLRRNMSRHFFSPMPFMYEHAWRGYGRRWWWPRVKAWFRRWRKGR